VTRAELARGLGVTAAQLKEWRTQLAAAGSAAAVTARQAEAEELAQLRRDDERLKEEPEAMRKASAFFARWATRT